MGQFELNCNVIVDQFLGGVSCTYSGAVGIVTFSCSYDDQPFEECEFVVQTLSSEMESKFLLLQVIFHWL